MLTPEWLLHCTDRLDELAEELAQSIMRSQVRRVAKLGYSDATGHQLQVLQEVWGLQQDVAGYISDYGRKAATGAGRLYTDAATRALAYDDAIYRAAGLSPGAVLQSPQMMNLLLASAEKTAGVLDNLTKTTAVMATDSFINASNLAYLQVSSGAMDYVNATKQAVSSLAKEGIRTVTYLKNGNVRKDQLDVAVRRNVLTGVNQTVGRLQLMRAEEMGSDHVEVTAHFGARPSHAEWQGGVYQISTGEFERVTGYGSGPGLCGWNCRHSFYPFFPGISRRVYTDDQLHDMSNRRVTYGGENIGQYEASQMQRAMEREIRETKREIVGLRELENIEYAHPEEAAAYRAEAAKLGVELKQQEAKLKDFVRQTGLTAQNDRTQTLKFGHSEASRAVWDARKGATLPKVAMASDTVLQQTLASDLIIGVIPTGTSIQSVRIIAGTGTSTVMKSASSLAETYGGTPSQWMKKGGIIETDSYRYDVHWEELRGQQYNTKIKGVKAK